MWNRHQKDLQCAVYIFSSSHFLPVRPNYLPQHFVLERHHSVFVFLRERPRFTPIKEKRHITSLRNLIFISIDRRRDLGICKTRKTLWELGDHVKPYVEFYAVQFSIKITSHITLIHSTENPPEQTKLSTNIYIFPKLRIWGVRWSLAFDCWKLRSFFTSMAQTNNSTQYVMENKDIFYSAYMFRPSWATITEKVK